MDPNRTSVTSENPVATESFMHSDDKGIVNYSASDRSENEYRAESPSEQVQLPVNSPVKWRSISVLSLEDA